MSLLRPNRRVTGPDGREWEIYAYKLTLRGRRLQKLGSAVHSMRGDVWTIDAVTYLPRETRYRWTTTSADRGQVLAQVEGHLARGDVPQHLAHAVFRGERD